MSKFLKIVHIAAEVPPFSQAGGLGLVARSLPKAIKRLGHEVIVITPLYGLIDRKKFCLKLLFPNVSLKLDGGDIYKTNYWQGWLKEDLPVYFIDRYEFFGRYKAIYKGGSKNERYFFFNMASLYLLKLLKFQPDVIHCHDWHAGLIPYLLKKNWRKDPFFQKTATLFTIHNLAHQMGPPREPIPREKEDKGHEPLASFENKKEVERINFARRAILFSDLINTVSEQYAKEILTKKFGERMQWILQKRRERLYGIINGIDYEDFNPKNDPGLVRNYDPDSLEKKVKNKLALQKKFSLPQNPEIPLIGMVTRISEQKGFDLIMEVIDKLMKLNFQLVLLGSGEERYEKFFRKISHQYPDQIACDFKFETKKATLIYAASDMFLMPSRFEPCGLGQLISLRYGSIPIVHAVGGLVDTVDDYDPKQDKGNGFVFYSYDSSELLVAIVRALENYKHKKAWQKLVRRAMKQSFSWEIPAQKYIVLYKKAIKLHRI